MFKFRISHCLAGLVFIGGACSTDSVANDVEANQADANGATAGDETPIQDGTTTGGSTPTALTCDPFDSNGVPIEYTFKGIGMKTALRDFVPEAINIVGACQIAIDQDGDGGVDETIQTRQAPVSIAPTAWTQITGENQPPRSGPGSYRVFDGRGNLLNYEQTVYFDIFDEFGAGSDCINESPRHEFDYNNKGSLERQSLSVWNFDGGDCFASDPEMSMEFTYDNDNCLAQSSFFDHLFTPSFGFFSKYRYLGSDLVFTRDSNGSILAIDIYDQDRDEDRGLRTPPEPVLITTLNSKNTLSYPSASLAIMNIDNAEDGIGASDMDGNAVDTTRSYASDALGRIIRIESDDNADGVVDELTLYEYDQDHRLTRIEENGEFRAYEFDAMGRVTEETRNNGYVKNIVYSCP